MSRLRDRNAELEARARLHATRIEDLDDEITRLRRTPGVEVTGR